MADEPAQARARGAAEEDRPERVRVSASDNVRAHARANVSASTAPLPPLTTPPDDPGRHRRQVGHAHDASTGLVWDGQISRGRADHRDGGRTKDDWRVLARERVLEQPSIHRSRGSLSSLHSLLSPGTLLSNGSSAGQVAGSNSNDKPSMTSATPAPAMSGSAEIPPGTEGSSFVPHPHASATNNKPRNALPRGLACIPCRQRKSRCTGERPSCAQCIAAAKRVRALLSSAIHGVGPDGERVDKRGRKRKAVSDDDVLECRYEAAEGETPVKRDAGKGQAKSKEAAGDGQGRKPGMGMGAVPDAVVTRQDAHALAAGNLPPIGHLTGGFGEMTQGPMDGTYAQGPAYNHAQDQGHGHMHASGSTHASLPLPQQTWSAPPPSAGFNEYAQPDATYAASSDNDRDRSESLPLRGGYHDNSQVDASGSAYVAPPLVPSQDASQSATQSLWPAHSSRPAYLDAMREAPYNTFHSDYAPLGQAPPPDQHWLSPPASQGSAGAAASSKPVLPTPQMQTDRFVVQPPLGAWELNAMVLPDGDVEVMAGSPLEYALIYHIIPHMPYLSMPLYPPKFLDSLLLPPNRRPHPALLYILLAYAVQAIVTDLPLPPNPAVIPAANFPVPFPEWTQVIKQQGMRLADLFLERSRRELDAGIRSVDRPYDLVRASIGISRYLYSFGRFVEGWNIPCTRLAVSCGLHRITNPVVAKISPFGDRRLSASYLSTDQGGPSPPTSTVSSGPEGKFNGWPGGGSRRDSRSAVVSPPLGNDPQMPTRLRMKAVIIGPPADVFDLAERLQVFWAIKAMDWAACVGWGWTGSLADTDVQSVWPRPYSEYEDGSVDANAVHGIWDLMNPQYSLGSASNDTTQIMAYKTLCLLTRATGLFDLPHPPSTLSESEMDGGNALPKPHPMTAEVLRTLGAAIEGYKTAMPTDPPLGPSDPWWIMAQTNLCCAEMLLFAEEANYRPGLHELAVNAARRMVFLVESLPEAHCTHLDLVVAIDVSLAARFLYLEAARLQRSGCGSEVFNAAEAEAGVLHRALNDTIGKRMHMSRLHGMIVQRVREGLPEKDGEFERS